MPKSIKKKKDKLQPRPPIVVVLGHIDHGKTTLLDYIRKTNVVEGESGGITQHIGAYQIEIPKESKSRASEASNQESSLVRGEASRGISGDARGDSLMSQKITFIDTPGHEAFSAMRSRGAEVADIAVLVVATDEGVKPQTKEAISHIQKSEIPVIVVLNKIDKSASDPEKTMNQLQEAGVVVEGRGGEIPCVKVAAKTGQGVDDLIEMILLVAEMEELKADPAKPASGVVIESYLDPRRGPTATFLVEDGTLRLKDYVAAGASFGSVKKMENFQGEEISEALPSTPVLVTGLENVPLVGEKFSAEKDEISARSKAEAFAAPVQILGDSSPEALKKINIILKADVKGSLEAIIESIKDIKFEEEAGLNTIKTEVGAVNESDIKLAIATKAVVIGFKVETDSQVKSLAERMGIKILNYDIIYDLIDGIKKELSKIISPEIKRIVLGKIKILEVFKTEKNYMIVGGKVIDGKVQRGARIDVLRGEEKIGKGRLAQLQEAKKDISEVAKGRECGVKFEGEGKIEKGDILEAYQEERKARTL